MPRNHYQAKSLRTEYRPPVLGNHFHGKSYVKELLGSLVHSVSIRNGVLSRKWETERENEVTWKLFVPDSLRAEVLKQLYDSSWDEPISFRKTTKQVIKARFHWCDLRLDVKSWYVWCDVCASRETPSENPISPMMTCNVGTPVERTFTVI